MFGSVLMLSRGFSLLVASAAALRVSQVAMLDTSEKSDQLLDFLRKNSALLSERLNSFIAEQQPKIDELAGDMPFSFGAAGVEMEMAIVSLSDADSVSLSFQSLEIDSTNSSARVGLDGEVALAKTVNVGLSGDLKVHPLWLGFGGMYQCSVGIELDNLSGKVDAWFMLEVGEDGSLGLDANLEDMNLGYPRMRSFTFECEGNNWVSDNVLSFFGESLGNALGFFANLFGGLVQKLLWPSANEGLESTLQDKLTSLVPQVFIYAFHFLDKWLDSEMQFFKLGANLMM